MFGGHTVTLAANGAEAVEKVEAAEPNLIMMDVRMPRMTGYEACRQIKTMDSVKDVPVVFLSAKGQDEEVQTGIGAGAVAYILKPFAPQELIEQVNALLKKYADAPPTPSAPTPPATPSTSTSTTSNEPSAPTTPEATPN
jgi:CheY-like chemotaxis protein